MAVPTLGQGGTHVATREEVLRALQHIRDPQSKASLYELGLIRDVVVRESGVSLSLIFVTEDAEAQAEMEAAIREALAETGVAAERIHIRSRMATEYEKSEVLRKAENAARGGERKKPVSLLEPDHPAVFIAVASGKGGVGKSTVTANLAVALARRGKRTAIIDADIYGFSIPDMMGIESRPEATEDGVRPVVSHGVKVMSMGFFVEDNAPVIWRGPMLGKMLRNFLTEVDWGELDYVLIDLPPGTGDVALDVHQLLPRSKEIIVTTPHATAAFVAARAGAMALHTNHEILGVVENMAWYERPDGGRDYVFGRGGGAKLAEELRTELLVQIPLGAPDNHPAEPDFAPSIYKEDTPTGRLYAELADKVIAKTAPA